jgi:hypothetical protein
MTRGPAAAGQFYDSDRERLIQQIEGSFTHELGPGLITDRHEGWVRACISPHAGYIFSGPAAAHGFKAIAESKDLPEIYICIGPSHSGRMSALSDEDWQTPLGKMQADKDIIRIMSENLDLPARNALHAMEHSIEVQLPFLQYISRDLKIAPLLISHDIDPFKVGRALGQMMKDFHLEDKACIIVSSDFTHFGPNYGYVPFKEHQQERVRELDMKAIERIRKLDPKGFLTYIEDTGATICGALPISLLLASMEDAETELLTYYTSGQILGDFRNSVSYASIIFR